MFGEIRNDICLINENMFNFQLLVLFKLVRSYQVQYNALTVYVTTAFIGEGGIVKSYVIHKHFV